MPTPSLLLLSPVLLLPQEGGPLAPDPVTSLSEYVASGVDYTAIDHGDFDGDGRLDAVVEAPGRDPLSLFAVAERQTIKQLPASGHLRVQRLALDDRVLEASESGLTQWSFAAGTGWSPSSVVSTPAERVVTRLLPDAAGSAVWSIGPGGFSFQALLCSHLDGSLLLSGPVVQLGTPTFAWTAADVAGDSAPDLVVTDALGLRALDPFGEPLFSMSREVLGSDPELDRLATLRDVVGEACAWIEGPQAERVGDDQVGGRVARHVGRRPG
ncbi:MAG: hypothetical protein AAFZ65_02840, partial [Planctomycetota bacterium]